jgi:hypothetical protein
MAGMCRLHCGKGTVALLGQASRAPFCDVASCMQHVVVGCQVGRLLGRCGVFATCTPSRLHLFDLELSEYSFEAATIVGGRLTRVPIGWLWWQTADTVASAVGGAAFGKQTAMESWFAVVGPTH